jgi:uncharacterized YigZ family protein
MLIPSGTAEIELIVKKSRFIAYACYIENSEDAKQIIAEARQKYSGASHVVHAWILGEARSIFSMSDDREPRHTAGRPVLEVVKGSGLTNILVLVIRYFGGVKLGTGGLVHAYSEAAKQVLSLIRKTEKVSKIHFTLYIEYVFYDQAKKILSARNTEILREDFGTGILIEGTVPDSGNRSATGSERRNGNGNGNGNAADALSREITNLTSGKSRLSLKE